MNTADIKTSFLAWLEWETVQEMIHATGNSTQELKQVLWAAFNAGVLEALISQPEMWAIFDTDETHDNNSL